MFPQGPCGPADRFRSSRHSFPGRPPGRAQVGSALGDSADLGRGRAAGRPHQRSSSRVRAAVLQTTRDSGRGCHRSNSHTRREPDRARGSAPQPRVPRPAQGTTTPHEATGTFKGRGSNLLPNDHARPTRARRGWLTQGSYAASQGRSTTGRRPDSGPTGYGFVPRSIVENVLGRLIQLRRRGGRTRGWEEKTTARTIETSRRIVHGLQHIANEIGRGVKAGRFRERQNRAPETATILRRQL